MQNIDAIKINFEESQLALLNICLGILMFGVALDLDFSEFRRMIKNPKKLLVGLSSQMILLPILTIILIMVLKPHASLAMGMVLVAACPGGNVSNYAVHLAKANTALSVTLTSISTLAAAFTTPLLFAIMRYSIPELANKSLIVPFDKMVITLLTLIVLPLVLGLLYRKYLPKLTQITLPWIKNLSMLIFLSFVVFAIVGNYENIKSYLSLVFVLVLIHNLLALSGGYYFAKLFRLETNDCRTISIETGIQNSGLGLILVFNFFDGLGGMALIAAWWGIWHLISSLLLALLWKRQTETGRLATEDQRT